MEKPFVLPAMPATSVKDSDPGDRTVTVFVDTDDAQTCKIELTGLTNEQVRDKIATERVAPTPGSGWPQNFRRIVVEVPVESSTTLQGLSLLFDVKQADIARANGMRGRDAIDTSTILVPITAREHGSEVSDLVSRYRAQSRADMESKVRVLQQATGSEDAIAARVAIQRNRGDVDAAIEEVRKYMRLGVSDVSPRAVSSANPFDDLPSTTHRGQHEVVAPPAHLLRALSQKGRDMATPQAPEKPGHFDKLVHMLGCCIRKPEYGAVLREEAIDDRELFQGSGFVDDSYRV